MPWHELPEESGATILWGCVALVVWVLVLAVILLVLWLT